MDEVTNEGTCAFSPPFPSQSTAVSVSARAQIVEFVSGPKSINLLRSPSVGLGGPCRRARAAILGQSTSCVATPANTSGRRRPPGARFGRTTPAFRLAGSGRHRTAPLEHDSGNLVRGYGERRVERQSGGHRQLSFRPGGRTRGSPAIRTRPFEGRHKAEARRRIPGSEVRAPTRRRRPAWRLCRRNRRRPERSLRPRPRARPAPATARSRVVYPPDPVYPERLEAIDQRRRFVLDRRLDSARRRIDAASRNAMRMAVAPSSGPAGASEIRKAAGPGPSSRTIRLHRVRRPD